MFTPTSTGIKAVFAAIFAIAVVFALQTASAQDSIVRTSSPQVNPYGQPLKGEDLIDAIDRDHPVSTQGTVNDPRLQNPKLKGQQLVDRVDRLYPADTSAVNPPDTRYQLDSTTMRSDEIIDTIDRLNEGKPIP